ncbi:hydroxyisourate hydrolase [Leptolyngbya sp. FACHB-261]|uniref:hydroxyisourate hydrolase n=1 Tax=Leptolyngbya sp. FACHB-261 TaxID=2692806 RepID=UPI001683724C|nr:hydroxyisourate hydrolase [Leptolyngbya sp. FACHB-261]MBD2104579.1 hydroxyisourate hydrolase [Leptolyngbya sp. FACHB-261]
MAGKLTTHVLDTAQGRPAAGMVIELWAVDRLANQRTLLSTTSTNSDGRTASPLIEEELKVGVYELVFAVGDYFAQQPINSPAPPFLDLVPIRFGIADANAHYHVPLLTSPWAYSTYRGS